MQLSRIGVVGGGTMASGIVEACVLADYDVVVRTRSEAASRSVKAALERHLRRRLTRNEIDDERYETAMSGVRYTTDIDDLYDRHLVIESVVEDIEVKKHLFSQLDHVLIEGAMIATNTSTLPVMALAATTKRPELVLGLHFFNPVGSLRLVEVVRSLVVAPEVLDAGVHFVQTLDKEPVIVNDEAGFVVNALLFPYLNTAVRLLERGVATKEDIDRAMMLGCNYPMGPLALLDLVGLDVAVAILERLYEETGDPAMLAAPTLRRMREAGQLGRKAGRGFYDYQSKI
ncbi:3-hydroxybutyryl-CoA dehydrogenase [Ferrimicrobium sp.]|uniref:3-hydroxyacyl-CoA dehydrogenase family protein n=1 Tax=Ferrimicrobium sp. TaxID=2926050 RepID=UPI00260F8D54|nr:3-hydroxybutyryl-CoA dehydrogenase [Ferrimicrobium sp.]